jgi:uncharacterized protein YaeQ
MARTTPAYNAAMAPNARIVKVDLQVSDMDRHHYGAHALTLAQHPSETDERVMVRLLAFALRAHERLEFGRGLSTADEPDLWQRDLTGRVEHWIELGQPDESRLRKAAGRADKVTLLGYQPRAFGQWWEKNASALERLRNLEVIELPAGIGEALALGIGRSVEAQCFVQDGHVQWMCGEQSLDFQPVVRQAADARA